MGIANAEDIQSERFVFDWVDPSGFTDDQKRLINKISAVSNRLRHSQEGNGHSSSPGKRKASITVPNYPLHELLSTATNKILGRDTTIEVRIFSAVETESGRKIYTVPAFITAYSHNRLIIGISEKTMTDDLEILSKLLHELGHFVTGKRDQDPEFRNFFVLGLVDDLATILRREWES
jgi:hypothetical protein